MPDAGASNKTRLCYKPPPVPAQARQDLEPWQGAQNWPTATALAACEPQEPCGVHRQARSGEAVAESERAQRGKNGKPMAGLCLRRSVRWARDSDGAGLAGFCCKRRDCRAIVPTLAGLQWR